MTGQTFRLPFWGQWPLILFLCLACASTSLVGDLKLVRNVKDIRQSPGQKIAVREEWTAVRSGTSAYFVLFHESYGFELWKTDGSREGTQLVQDVFPGAHSSEISCLAAFSGGVFFRADDGVHGSELWRSDGTPEGTQLVKDLFPGLSDGAHDPLCRQAFMGGRLYFIAKTPGTGEELWVSDGTERGTRLVADIAPGPRPSTPSNFRRIGGQLLFRANDGARGTEIWKVDEAIRVSLDCDDNRVADPLTDGLLMIRYLFGFEGESLALDVIGPAAGRSTPEEIKEYIDLIVAQLDIDGDGRSDALTDGLLSLRYLFGFRSAPLTAGAVGSGCTRCTPTSVEAYLAFLIPQ